MYYPDLTVYSYFSDFGHKAYSFDTEKRTLNVGWLEPPHPFATGQASEEFLDALFALCFTPVNVTRGLHFCLHCENPPTSELKFTLNGEQRSLTIPNPVKEHRGGRTIGLGSAEIRACDEEVCYAAPNMVYHYVSAHNYLPPEPFIRAVLKSAL